MGELNCGLGFLEMSQSLPKQGHRWPAVLDSFPAGRCLISQAEESMGMAREETECACLISVGACKAAIKAGLVPKAASRYKPRQGSFAMQVFVTSAKCLEAGAQ